MERARQPKFKLEHLAAVLGADGQGLLHGATAEAAIEKVAGSLDPASPARAREALRATRRVLERRGHSPQRMSLDKLRGHIRTFCRKGLFQKTRNAKTYEIGPTASLIHRLRDWPMRDLLPPPPPGAELPDPRWRTPPVRPKPGRVLTYGMRALDERERELARRVGEVIRSAVDVLCVLHGDGRLDRRAPERTFVVVAAASSDPVVIRALKADPERRERFLEAAEEALSEASAALGASADVHLGMTWDERLSQMFDIEEERRGRHDIKPALGGIREAPREAPAQGSPEAPPSASSRPPRRSSRGNAPRRRA